MAESYCQVRDNRHTEGRRHILAQLIQDTIEGEIEDMRRNYEPPDGWDQITGPDLRQQQIEAMKLK